MAISWNDEEQIYRITRTMAAGDQDITGATSTFNYFDDASVVDDAIYFNSVMKKYSGLRVNVGTALLATSVSGVWEYYNGSWTSLDNIVDNTNLFQNAGDLTIRWDMPIDWRCSATVGPSSASRGYNVRCRMTTVSGITEGGANSTNTVKEETYAVWINGGATHSLDEIYNADVAGGWGVVTKDLSEKSFLINANVYINNGQLNIKNHETLIVGKKPMYTGEHFAIQIGTNGTLQIGEKAASGFAYNGGKLIWNNGKHLGSYLYWYGNVKMYGAYFWIYGGGYVALSFGCTFDIVDSFWDCGSSHTWYLTGSSSGSFERVLIGCYYLYVYTGSVSFKDTNLTRYETGGNPYGALAGSGSYFAKITGMDFQDFIVCTVCQSASMALIDCDNFQDSQYRNFGTYTKPMHLHRRFTFNVRVVNMAGDFIPDAVVTLCDVDGRSGLFEDVKTVYSNARITSLSTPTDITASVTDGSRYNIGEVLRVRGELMLITNIVGNTLTVVRNLEGSTANGVLNTCAPYIRREYVLTDSNGEIGYGGDKLFEVTVKDFSKLNGVDLPIKDFNNFVLKVTKPGYKIYEQSFTLDKSTYWPVRLVYSNINIDQESF